jgi:hypothetical protein
VCFDIIDKIKELALAGDKQADLYAVQIEKNRNDGDIVSALEFEREILELAQKKFELISYIEFTDLKRLQEDRNRCAHPSMVSEEKVFTPSAELARIHIYSAVTHLLQHPPVQGKFALNRLLAEVNSEYFPSDLEKAVLALSSGPLKKPRDSLVRNFALVILKQLLKEKLEWKKNFKLAIALKATRKLHPIWTESLFKEKLTSIARSLQDSELDRIITLLRNMPDIWQYLETDMRQKIENLTANLPVENLDDLDFLLEFQPLKTFAENRVGRITKKEFSHTFFFTLPEALGNAIIKRYLSSPSFDEANYWAQNLKMYAPEFNAEQITTILVGAANNEQVLGSFGLSTLIASLRKTKRLTAEVFANLLTESGLERFNLDEQET